MYEMRTEKSRFNDFNRLQDALSGSIEPGICSLSARSQGGLITPMTINLYGKEKWSLSDPHPPLGSNRWLQHWYGKTTKV